MTPKRKPNESMYGFLQRAQQTHLVNHRWVNGVCARCGIVKPPVTVEAFRNRVACISKRDRKTRMHPKLAEAIQQIDAAVFNGDTFEIPEHRTELLGYIERWCKQLAQPYRGAKPLDFKTEWAKKEAAGYQYGGDALENVEFGFDIAKEAYARGYNEHDGPDDPEISDPRDLESPHGGDE